MLEDLRTKLEKLISLYEKERQENDRLRAALEKSVSEGAKAKETIAELESRIETLKLTEAFTAGGDTAAAREKIDRLLREMDKCISWLES